MDTFPNFGPKYCSTVTLESVSYRYTARLGIWKSLYSDARNLSEGLREAGLFAFLCGTAFSSWVTSPQHLLVELKYEGLCADPLDGVFNRRERIFHNFGNFGLSGQGSLADLTNLHTFWTVRTTNSIFPSLFDVESTPVLIFLFIQGKRVSLFIKRAKNRDHVSTDQDYFDVRERPCGFW